MPHLQEIWERYEELGMNMVAINVVPAQDNLVPQWKASRGFRFPVLVGANPSRLSRDYQLTVTPLNYLVDAEGNTIQRFEGYRPGAEQKIEDKVREVLGLTEMAGEAAAR